MEITISKYDESKIIKEVANSIINSYKTTSFRNEILNIVAKNLTNEILEDEQIKNRINEIFEKADKTIQGRINKEFSIKIEE